MLHSVQDTHLLDFPQRSDLRGSLTAIEDYQHVPFSIKRVFYIKHMDALARGFHAHRKAHQVLVPLCGSFVARVKDPTEEKMYRLEHDAQGLFIPTGVWIEMESFSKDCVILVLPISFFLITRYVTKPWCTKLIDGCLVISI